MKKLQMNFAGSRLSPWLGHIMESEQESPRPLLTPGEILQLPGDDALVMIGGLPPYRAKKIMYYQDDRFRERAWLPTPDDAESQRAELLPDQYWQNSWLAETAGINRIPRVHKEPSEKLNDEGKISKEELHDVIDEAIQENTFAVSIEDRGSSIERNNNRAGIIDFSRTPQGGHLPL